MDASHLRLPMALLGILLLVLPLAPTTPAASAQSPAVAARAALPGGSMETQEPASKAEGGEPVPWLQRGVALLKQGRPEAARSAFAEFVRRAPEAEAWRAVANAYLVEGRLPETIAALQEMRRREDEPELSPIIRSLVFALEGSAAEAVSGLREAVQAGPNAGLWNLLGQQLERAGRMRDAIQAYAYATQLRPDEPRFWRCLGEAYEQMGQYPRALASHREVLARHPGPDAWSAVGRVELAQKDYVEAAKAYDQAVTLAPRDLDALAGLGIAYGAQKEWAAALDTYYKVKAIDPVAAEELFGIVFAGRKS